MNNFGPGCPPTQGNNDTMFLFLMLMIMCPGMFAGGGNSILPILLIFMMFSGGSF